MGIDSIGEQAAVSLGWEGWRDEPRDSHGQWTRGGAGLLDRATGSAKHPPAVQPITAAEARGNSRAVSADEFQALAREGLGEIGRLAANRSPVTGLDRNWPKVKDHAWAEVQKPWGGATIDSHTGQPLASNADKYALSVKPQGLHTVSVPETASRADFDAAMDRALAGFRGTLENQQHHLGVFHDDDNHRIDIDPVLVVDMPHEVETIGSYTHAIGGAYHFATGNGYFPPHVGADMSESGQISWKGPGHWRSDADSRQPGLARQQLDEIAQAAAGQDDETDLSCLISSQLFDLAASHGRHVSGTSYTYRHGWIPISDQVMKTSARPPAAPGIASQAAGKSLIAPDTDADRQREKRPPAEQQDHV